MLSMLIVGMVMDTTPAILILTPILLPIVQAIGMDPIQFGVIMVCLLYTSKNHVFASLDHE